MFPFVILSTLSAGALQQRDGGVNPLTILLLVALLILIIWWLLRSQTDQVEPMETHDHDHDHLEDAPAAVKEAVSSEPDDLRKIEGIGPKVQSVLNAAGIATFAQLAGANVDHLQSVLDEAGYQYMNPASWPEQAGLADAGDWDALQKLQDELNAGKS